MLLHAEKEVIIMCSYFLPGRAIRKAMAKASKRGVMIKTILAGPSDVMIAKHAERYLYDWLLKNNIRIFEYQKTVLHAKIALYDNRWVTIGSYNVNNISAYASLELNLDIRNRPFAVSTATFLNQIMNTDCKEITRENYASATGFFRRLWQRLCYGFINNMLSLFTFYFKQEE
jgi:cardiolipin synthase